MSVPTTDHATAPDGAGTRLTSHLGVYAAILDADAVSILLIRKARGPYLGLLDLPGGSLEPDELPDEALAREIREETGCRPIPVRQLSTVGIRYDYRDPALGPSRLRHVGILYRAHIEGVPSPSGDGEDSDGCLWHRIGAPEDRLTPLAREAIRLVGTA